MADDKNSKSGLSISDFKSNVSEGFSRSSLFHVNITPPSMVFGGDGEEFKFTCDQAQLPGYTLKTEERSIAGITSEMPLGFALEKLQLSFLTRSGMDERLFFDKWFSNIVNITEKGPRRMGYYVDYVGEVEVKVYDVTGSNVYTVVCKSCYPQTMTSQSLNWSETGIIRITVDFAYEYWETGVLD